MGKFVLHMAVTTGTPTQMYLSSVFQKILKDNISFFYLPISIMMYIYIENIIKTINLLQV